MTHWSKTMSSLVFLFSKKQVLSCSGFFYCFGGLKRKPIVLHVEISIFWATPSNVIFPNKPCFCFDIQIEFQHFWWPVLFYCFLIKSIILCATYDIKFHIWPPGLKIFAGVEMLLCCMRANVFTTRNNRAKKASNLNLDSCQRCHFIRALLSSMYLP